MTAAGHLAQTRPVMLSVAPNGARRQKHEHPALPLTPGELAQTAAECLDAGASLFHVHVRDARGRHLLDADAYRAAFHKIRRAVGQELVLQATTEAVGHYLPAQQRQLIRELQPEAVSIAIREITADGDDHANAALFQWAQEHGLLVQFIVYDDHDEQQLEQMVRQGILPWTPRWTLRVLGKYQPSQHAQPQEVQEFAARTAPPWVVCAFGPHELECARSAIRLGGHIRIGFENNVLTNSGKVAASNAAQLRALRPALEAAQAQAVSADWLRQHWHE